MKEKVCTKCGVVKPISDFYKDKTRKFGVYPACKTCSNVYKKTWRDKNRERINLTTKIYRENNSEKVKAANKKWNSFNKEKLCNYQLERRVQKKQNGVFQVSDKELFSLYRSKCFYCDQSKSVEIDHIIPINRGGRHSIGNLVAACRKCNASKNNKLLIEWKYRKTSS